MEKYMYMKTPLKYITQEIMGEYDINSIASNSFVCVEIRKGMYGIKEAGIIAFKHLVQNLAPHDSHPYKHAPDPWTHKTR